VKKKVGEDNRKDVIEDGILSKAATIEPGEATESELKQINKYALAPLKAEDVFVFKSVIGDNETDDRNGEPFNLRALKDMEKLYPGKTVLKDHRRQADNQVARIYATELVTEPKLTGAGEPFTKIVAKSYMVRTAANADLIKEIQGGIKKEVSTGVRPKRLICNICGSDNMKTYCPHWPGREYEKEGGKTTCTLTIDGVKEAYELSLVAIPAQPRAGTIKHYGPKPEPEKAGEEAATPKVDENTPAEEKQAETPKSTEIEDAMITELRTRDVESFIYVNKAISNSMEEKE
jgi:hypothetical protein